MKKQMLLGAAAVAFAIVSYAAYVPSTSAG